MIILKLLVRLLSLRQSYPGSGKMAVCLSQLFHEHKRGIKAGYAKFETFPIWNLPLNHSVNLAYEAATADLKDVNMIDPWHLEAYGKLLLIIIEMLRFFRSKRMFKDIWGESPYKSLYRYGRKYGWILYC